MRWYVLSPVTCRYTSLAKPLPPRLPVHRPGWLPWRFPASHTETSAPRPRLVLPGTRNLRQSVKSAATPPFKADDLPPEYLRRHPPPRSPIRVHSRAFAAPPVFKTTVIPQPSSPPPLQFFAALRLRVRKQFNEAKAVFPTQFSASPASLVESEPVEDCGESAFQAPTTTRLFTRDARLTVSELPSHEVA